MKQKAKNKGFTLIEVLVTMAIVTVITAISGITIGAVNNANVSKAANTLNSLINTARSTSISKGTEAGRLTLTMENGVLYGSIGGGEKQKICNKQITVYKNDYIGSASYSTDSRGIAAGNKLADGEYVIYFKPSGVVDDDYLSAEGVSCDSMCRVIFQKGSRNVEVVLYRQTGKHEVNLF